MLRYIIKRLLGMIPTLFIVITLVFFFVRMIPGDPARLVAGEQATAEDVAQVRQDLGLDQPIIVQYGKYVSGLLKGDLGTSLRSKRPVAQDIGERYINTLRLTALSILWSVLIGILLGVWAGAHRNKWQDYLGMTLSVSGISLPSFWVGFLLIMLFSVKLRWFPTTGATGFKSLVLPSITLGISISAVIARFTRSSIVKFSRKISFVRQELRALRKRL